jgi:hypothetical protein
MRVRPALLLAALALAVAACLAACNGGGGASVEGGPPVPRDFFGMNAQIVAQAAQAGKVEYAETQAAQIARTGVGFVRSAFDWALVEPEAPVGGRHAYDLSGLDPWVAALARNRMRWLPTVKGGPVPDWAGIRGLGDECGTNSPPARTADYAALMDALARRYGRDGSFWDDHPDLPYEPVTDYEAWNEPNFARLWCPEPDPPAYARLYLAAREAVHAVDPKAVVLLGGLAAFPVDEAGPPAKMTPDTFLSQAVEAVPRLRDRVDAVAVHPYGANPDAVLAALGRFRSALDANGLAGQKMLADEIGWHTQGAVGLPAVPEEQRAEYFAEVTPAVTRSNCGVIGIAAHTWVTLEHRPAYSEHWLGMADPLTGEPYPSATAYREQVRALEHGRPVATSPSPC